LTNGLKASQKKEFEEVAMNIQEFLQVLKSKTGVEAKKSNNGYLTCCPAHEDRNPSFSLCQGSDGKILVNCFAGCTLEDICTSLSLHTSDMFNGSHKEFKETKKTVYAYRDEHGQELYRKIRIEPGANGKTKDFFCEREENGQLIKSLKGCRKVLYHFPEVLKAIVDHEPVFLVEGEKDADKLRQYGLTSTTSQESLKWQDDFTDTLRDADVVILYDMDKTGLERRDLLCRQLHGKVKRLRVVNLPGLEYQESHGKDINDWLANGNTIADLQEILSKTPEFQPLDEKKRIRVVTLADFLSMELPKREMILSPFLPSQGLCLLYAKRGVGKTHVAIGIAYAVAVGGRFLKWDAPKPRKVLYIDGEMPAAAMQERLKRISVSENLKLPAPDYIRLITPDLQDGPMPDLSTLEGRNILKELIGDSELIIIDNLSSLFRSGVENEAESWQPVQDWALEMRKNGKTIIFIHHAAKGGQQRGTSKKEDILDTVIVLKQPQGYRSEQGASFEVNFEKTRHFAGEDAAPFKVNLKEQLDGLWEWEISNSEEDNLELSAVAEATNDGLTIQQIMQRTGLTKSQVETRKKKAKEKGLIKD